MFSYLMVKNLLTSFEMTDQVQSKRVADMSFILLTHRTVLLLFKKIKREVFPLLSPFKSVINQSFHVGDGSVPCAGLAGRVGHLAQAGV